MTRSLRVAGIDRLGRLACAPTGAKPVPAIRSNRSALAVCARWLAILGMCCALAQTHAVAQTSGITAQVQRPTASSAARSLPASFVVPEARTIEVNARKLTSFSRSGSEKRFGRLEFRGGLVLTSSSKLFGGFSGITVEPDGRRFMAVSDEGAWLSGEIAYEGTVPAEIKGARMGPYLALAGRTLDRKRDNDAEAIVLFEGNLARGTVLIGFERNHRIGRFPVIDGVLQAPTAYLKLPAEARRMRQNKGFEAVTVMQGGPYKGAPLAFSERFPGEPGQHTGWIWINGEPQRLLLTDIGEHDITDVASLADGSLLVLERRFRWSEWLQGVKMRVRRIAARDVRPGHLMQGEALLEADMSREIDNMEGLAVHRGPGGETVLTMISDNNFNSFLQRTVLLQFTLVE